MNTERDINELIRLQMAKDKYPDDFKRSPLEMRLRDFWLQFDKRLNNPVWLVEQSQAGNEYDSAHIIGCSPELVRKKVIQYGAGVCIDQIFEVRTGFFHYTKRFFIPLLKPYVKKIQQGIDTVFDKTKSRNADIFKQIMSEMEKVDDDKEPSTFGEFALTRKEGYLLAMKFIICLYEYDSYYAERMDYVLSRLMEKQSKVYLDDTAKPENWYPHRNTELSYLYMFRRNQL